MISVLTSRNMTTTFSMELLCAHFIDFFDFHHFLLVWNHCLAFAEGP